MIKRAILLFIIIAPLAFFWTYYFNSPGDCGLLPEHYRTERFPEEWIPAFLSDSGKSEFQLGPDGRSKFPCVLREAGWVGMGSPVFYLTAQTGSRRLPPPPGGVFYPQFLLVNIAWIAAASIGLAGLWELRKRRRRPKPATSETTGGIAQP